jgi:hypothetical protein
MSNLDAEIKATGKSYFGQGATEVCFFDKYVDVSFYSSRLKIKRLKVFPEFPLIVLICEWIKILLS